MKPTAIEFSEVMKGSLLPGVHSLESLEENAEDSRQVTLWLTLRIPDLDAFLDDLHHRGQLSGFLASPFFGEARLPLKNGIFHLLEPTADRDRHDMSYRFHFEDQQGHPRTFSGRKQVQDHLGPDLWRDTTTLDFNLFEGHLSREEEAQGTILATGRVRIDLPGLLRQLASLRSNAPTASARARAIARFGRFFLGELWTLYAPGGLPPRKEFRRTLPLFTTEGVCDALVDSFPFLSGDGLGLSLLRFQRRPGNDLVLLVPGLTASSDLFIMPEHYNLVQYLLDQGFNEVWTLDGRISNRHPYNLQRHRWNADDVALYDYPAALEKIREVAGPNKRIHVIAHCFGALTFSMSLAAGLTGPIQSLVVNGVSLTPRVPALSRLKLALGPALMEHLMGVEYINPRWQRQPGWSPGKLLSWGVSLVHRECNCPECHMISFMWGSGKPALYLHENLQPATHERIGDLLGGSGAHYYRHIHKMVKAGRAVKFDPGDPRHTELPEDYLAQAKNITTPILFITGQENRVFTDSNIHCYQLFEEQAPARHQLEVFAGYGHIDIFMGRKAHQEIFPRLTRFLKQHRIQGG